MHKLITDFNTAEPFSNGYIWFKSTNYVATSYLLSK